MKEKILTRLEALFDREADEKMEFAAERSVEMMEAYCGRKDLPEELAGVGVSLAAKLLERGVGASEAKSIKEGDVSVTFAEGVSEESEMLEGFKAELDRYRQMGW